VNDTEERPVSRRAQQLIKLRKKKARIKRDLDRATPHYNRWKGRYDYLKTDLDSVTDSIRVIEGMLRPEQAEDYELLKAKAVAEAALYGGGK
jgi:hypothetical protein